MTVTSTQIVVTNERYSVDLLKRNPHKLYVFGDNAARKGRGGQAVIREMPNAFGIATKRYPSMEEKAFFNDHCIDDMDVMLQDVFDLRVISKMRVFTHIVFPAGGIGTGMSQMPQRCPVLFETMMEELYQYFQLKYDFVRHNLYITSSRMEDDNEFVGEK